MESWRMRCPTDQSQIVELCIPWVPNPPTSLFVEPKCFSEIKLSPEISRCPLKLAKPFKALHPFSYICFSYSGNPHANKVESGYHSEQPRVSSSTFVFIGAPDDSTTIVLEFLLRRTGNCVHLGLRDLTEECSIYMCLIQLTRLGNVHGLNFGMQLEEMRMLIRSMTS